MGFMFTYALSFVHPKNQKTLFVGQGRRCIHFETNKVPAIGEIIALNVFVTIPKCARRGYRFQFKVVEVARSILCFRPHRKNCATTFTPIKEQEHFWIKVQPTTKKFDSTLRTIKKFYAQAPGHSKIT
jgi:hypothetical protein